MKKIYVKFAICTIIAIGIITIAAFFYKRKENNINKNLNNSIENLVEDNSLESRIEDIKQDLGYNNNADTTIYEIKKEYDGREVLAIKPNIQYKVAMAGVLKNAKPEFLEIDNLLKQAPNKSGIWIEKNSREDFLKILKNNTNATYQIDEEGYLKQTQTDNANEIDNLIKKVMSKNHNYSFSINSAAYLIDEVTGNIEEYPFEEIDREAPYELFEAENATLYVITPNTYKKLDYKDIFEEVFKNIIQ